LCTQSTSARQSGCAVLRVFIFRVFVVKARPGLHAFHLPHPIIALVVSSRFLFGLVLPSCLVVRVFVVGGSAPAL
jgi:hypothetical protein